MEVFCSLGVCEPNQIKVRLDTPMASREDISAMRRQYGEAGLLESALPKDPVELFNTWLH